MACQRCRHFKLERVLKWFVLFELLYWFIMAGSIIVIYYRQKNGDAIKNDIRAQLSNKPEKEIQAAYTNLLAKLEFLTNWLVPTAVLLFVVQIFLYFGLSKKNRCLIFCWIVFTVSVGISRLIIVFYYLDNEYFFLKIFAWTWPFRFVFIFFAASYMVELTNQRRAAEELPPPHFRPQTDDPREFEEGLNYSSYPRSLQFADRVVGMDKKEHARPARWVPTYEALDSDGRMVVVVDDPVYESL